MKYFILRQHPYFSESFRLDGWQEVIKPKWICMEEFYKTPRRCVISASMGEFTPFPDIVTVPFLLISRLMAEVAEMYGEPVFKRDVIIINERDKQSRHYHLILPEAIGHGSALLGESHLFYMNIDQQKELGVSQDYAESILRRGAVGIALKEWDMKEGRHDGK